MKDIRIILILMALVSLNGMAQVTSRTSTKVPSQTVSIRNQVVSETGDYVSYVYDGKEQLVSVSYFTAFGIRMRSEYGYARVEYSYNEHGLLTSTKYLNLSNKPCRDYTVTEYDEHDRLVSETRYNTLDKVQSKKVYSYDATGHKTSEKRYSGGTQSRYRETVWTYDDEGRIRMATELNSGRPVTQGISKVIYSYEGNNRYSQSFYDAKDKWLYTKNIEEDEKGRVSADYFTNEKGKVVINKEFGYARAEYTYDSVGRKTSESYYTPDGRRYINPTEDYARSEYRYNDDGSLSSKAYYGSDGLPYFSHQDGFAKLEYTYKSNGDVDEVRIEDEHGRELLRMVEWEGLRDRMPVCSRDDHGHISELVFYDNDNRIYPSGVARIGYRYDHLGRVSEVTFCAASGQPIGLFTYDVLDAYEALYGTAKIVYEYQDDNLVKTIDYDEHGHQIMNREETAYYDALEYTYNDDGRLISERRFLFDALAKYGPSRLDYTYDRQGRLASVSFFNDKDMPTRPFSDEYECGDILDRYVVKIGYRYDTLDKATEVYYDIFGRELEETDDGYMATSFDDAGRIKTIYMYDYKGRPVKGAPAIIEYVYDDRGRLITKTYYDAKMHMVAAQDDYPYSVVGWTYDEKDNQVSESYYDAGGRLLDDADGVAQWEATYDVRGNRLSKSYYNSKSQFCMGADFARAIYTYDDHNNLTSEAHYDAENRLYPDEDSIAKKLYRYNERDQQTYTMLLNRMGLPVNGKKGWASMSKTFDDEGRITSEAFYDDSARLVVDPNVGYARFEAEYDPAGHRTLEAYYDAQNRLSTFKKRDWGKRVVRYNKWGGLTELAYYGEDGGLTNRSVAWARMEGFYNDHGDLIAAAYYTADGKRALNSDEGWSSYEAFYNDSNQLLSQSYYGVDERLTMSADYGYARYEAEYDEQYRLVREAYFNSLNRLVMNEKAGFAMRAIRYDEDGEKLEYVTFDSRNNPISTSHRALYEILTSRLRYPEECREQGIEGVVMLRFVLEADGTLTNAELVESSGNKALDEEALRVVRVAPGWYPMSMDNKPVRSEFTMPIYFRLAKAE